MQDNTTTTNYPKTLLIRNTVGGMIWQIYHVQNIFEAQILSKNATNNGFQSTSLEEHIPDQEETFPDWRETSGGKRVISEALADVKNESDLNAFESQSTE